MEHLWLAITIASAIWAVWEINRIGWESGKEWLYIPGIAAAMFVFRRFARKKMEAYNQRQQEKESKGEQ